MRYILIGIIKFYQLAISPHFPSRCRFRPTCSRYAIDAINKRGVFKGVWLGIKRILRCHPFSKGGYDPIPDHSSETKSVLVKQIPQNENFG